MTSRQSNFTANEVMAKARQILVDADYADSSQALKSDSTIASALFEDRYGVVGIFVYDMTDALIDGWLRAQQSVSEVISSHWSRSDPKAWEGYLILIALEAPLTSSSDIELDRISHDTSHLRKLVITSKSMDSISDLNQLLEPVLAFSVESRSITASTDPLEDLTRNLSRSNPSLPMSAIDSIVRAFRERRDLTGAIHDSLEGGIEPS